MTGTPRESDSRVVVSVKLKWVAMGGWPDDEAIKSQVKMNGKQEVGGGHFTVQYASGTEREEKACG